MAAATNSYGSIYSPSAPTAAPAGTTPAPAPAAAPAVVVPAPPQTLLEACAPLAAEFIGTYLLAFTAAYCCLAPTSPVWTPTAIGGVLVALICAIGKVSGANFNPAVSLCLGIIGALDWRSVIRYCVTQILAAMLAVSMCMNFLGNRDLILGPKPGYSFGSAALVELIYTAVLCLVVACCAASKRNNPQTDGNQFVPLAIGLTVTAGIFAAGPISGGVLNPAVAIGVAHAGGGMSHIFTWVLAELVGSVFAAGIYRGIRAEEYLLPEMAILEYKPRLQSRLFAELFGSFVLVLTVGLNVITLSAATPWAVCAVLAALVYSLRDISGAHLNPAVTLAVLLSGREKLSVRDGIYYAMVQLLGGVFAGIVQGGIHESGPNASSTFGLQPGAGYTLRGAGVAEAMFTGVLAFTVLSVTTTRPPSSWLSRHNALFGLAIGLSAAAGGFAAGPVSGGELNPAVSVGIATGSWFHQGAQPAPPMTNCVVLVLWEFLGSAKAATLFRLAHAAEYASGGILGK